MKDKSTHTPYSVNTKYVRGQPYDGTLNNKKTIQISKKEHCKAVPSRSV